MQVSYNFERIVRDQSQTEVGQRSEEVFREKSGRNRELIGG